AANFATQITGGSTANGFDASPNNSSSIRFFSGGLWNTPANTNSTGVNSQEGWLLFVRGDRENYGEITNQFKLPTITTLRPRGQIFLGQKTITASGLQTVGNPYASAVDYFNMTRTGAGWPASPTYFVWDPSLGGANGVGAWVALTWNGSNFTRSAPLSGTGTSNYDNRYIASGAAIMVDFPAGGGTLSMNEANKNTDSTTTAFRPVRQLMTSLQAKDADNTLYVADAALSLFGNQFNDAADVDDARKLSNVNENICLRRNDGYLSIERKKLNADADTIFYFINKLQKKEYKLRFEMDNIDLPASTAAFLEDTYLKTKTPVSISGTTEAGFAVTNDAGSAATERFRLVFRRSVWYSSIQADILNSDVAVSWSVRDELNIENYEIERSSNGSSFTTIASQLSRGNSEIPVAYNGLDISPAPGEYYYRIKSTSKNGIVTYSDVVKVKVVRSTPHMYVFPNPVTNSTIQLQLNNAMEGVYSTTLFGNNGQVINNELINHAGGTSTKAIRLKQQITDGTYQLRITAPDNTITVIKVVVVNE
ncbi:MAG TPA: T9SS type A sorting domain-containing protein, partial [Ferruginibacter sp.]|nr:T9SS type A sorting domain-containing protein [Ferruginibacter sp.]